MPDQNQARNQAAKPQQQQMQQPNTVGYYCILDFSKMLFLGGKNFIDNSYLNLVSVLKFLVMASISILLIDGIYPIDLSP